jgi:hypothetical protein
LFFSGAVVDGASIPDLSTNMRNRLRPGIAAPLKNKTVCLTAVVSINRQPLWGFGGTPHTSYSTENSEEPKDHGTSKQVVAGPTVQLRGTTGGFWRSKRFVKILSA